MVVLGPALPESGWRGGTMVEDPVVRGGRRPLRVEVLRREGNCGSMAMAPSFWRSRIFRSSRFICRSSCYSC